MQPAPYRIVHIDLAQPVTGLEKAESFNACQLYFWLSGVPIGDCLISSAELPLSSERLAQLAAANVAPAVGNYSTPNLFQPELPETGAPRHIDPADIHACLDNPSPMRQLATAHRVGDRSQSNSQSVSVVVCSRDRAIQLRTCLKSLLTLAPSPLEIIVVDNASSTSATRDVVQRYPGVRYVLESRPGLDYARNAGAKAAAGDVVAYTDDDVTVHPKWLQHIAEAFSGRDVGAVTGLVLPWELETEAQLIFEKVFGGFNRGYRRKRFDRVYFAQVQGRGAPVWEIGAGANMAFRRSLLLQLGAFDERLDVGRAGCNGDSECWYRFLASGYTCLYEPQAVVFHHHRRDLASLQKQMKAYMKGFVAALLVQFERSGHWGNLRRALLQAPYDYIKLLVSASARGFPTGQRILLGTAPSCLAGIAYYLTHPRKEGQR